MPKSKKITIERLAEMVQGGFGEVHDKFDEIHNKMDKGFSELYNKVNSLDQKVASNTTSIRILSGEIAELKVTIEDQNHEGRLKKHEVQFQQHDRRIRKLEETTDLAKP